LTPFGGFALFSALASPAAQANPGAVGDLFTPTLFIGFGLAALAGIFLALGATGATYAASADGFAGRPVDLVSLMASGLKRVGPILGFYDIVGFVRLSAFGS
jgi:hypothetical protein